MKLQDVLDEEDLSVKYKSKPRKKVHKRANHKHLYVKTLYKDVYKNKWMRKEIISYTLAEKCSVCGKMGNYRFAHGRSIPEFLKQYEGIPIVERGHDDSFYPTCGG